MNIGEVAKKTGLPVKTIRYYEDIGLIEPSRTESGYRQFGQAELHKLAFVRRARSLGSSVDRCRSLLNLYEDQERSSADAKRLAQLHLEEIEAKITELRGMHDVLQDLVERCAGDHRPDCPILDKLGDPQCKA